MSSTRWDDSELAERYDRVSDVQFRSGRLLAEKLGVKKSEHVLDVGCGTGRLALYMCDLVGSKGFVTGIDPSSYRINVAQAKLKDKKRRNVRFLIGKAEDLDDFPEESFDHVLYSSVFHWVDDKRRAVEEAYRVLKHGGNIGMTTVDKSHPFAMRKMMEKLFSEEPYSGRVDFHGEMDMLVDREELEGLLFSAGFRRIDMSYDTEMHHYTSAEQLFSFIEASSFGNFLRDIPEELRRRALDDMKMIVNTMKTKKGIEIPATTLFAVAYKPLL